MEYSPDKFVMRTTEGPFPMETTYTFRTVDENSTSRYCAIAATLQASPKLFAPFMAMMMRKANNKDLKSIKAILEEKH